MGLSPSPRLAVMAQALGVGFSPTSYRSPTPEFQSWAGLLREKMEGTVCVFSLWCPSTEEVRAWR